MKLRIMVVIFPPSGKATFRPSRHHEVYKKGEVCDNIAEVISDEPIFVFLIDWTHKILLFLFSFGV